MPNANAILMFSFSPHYNEPRQCILNGLEEITLVPGQEAIVIIGADRSVHNCSSFMQYLTNRKLQYGYLDSSQFLFTVLNLLCSRLYLHLFRKNMLELQHC